MCEVLISAVGKVEHKTVLCVFSGPPQRHNGVVKLFCYRRHLTMELRFIFLFWWFLFLFLPLSCHLSCLLTVPLYFFCLFFNKINVHILSLIDFFFVYFFSQNFIYIYQIQKSLIKN